MSCIAWSPTLELQQPAMDATHREFVEHLQATEAALSEPATVWLAHYQAMLAHTEAHFAQEERWMREIGFDPENCHARQHASVLLTMREVGQQLAGSPDAALLRQLIEELAQWFSLHARSMDAALSELIDRAAFDPATGRCEGTVNLSESARHGCGNSSCL